MEQFSNQCHNSYFPLLLQETIKNIFFSQSRSQNYSLIELCTVS